MNSSACTHTVASIMILRHFRYCRVRAVCFNDHNIVVDGASFDPRSPKTPNGVILHKLRALKPIRTARSKLYYQLPYSNGSKPTHTHTQLRVRVGGTQTKL